jgi:hypothetical protein
MEHYFVGVAHPAPSVKVNKIIERNKPGCVLSKNDLAGLLTYMIGLPITYNHNGTIDHYHATPSRSTYKQSKDAFEMIGKTSIKKAVIGYIKAVTQTKKGAVYVLFSIEDKYSGNFGYLVKSGMLNGLSLTHTDTNISQSTRLTLPNELSLVFEPCRPNCHVIMTSPDAAVLRSYMRGLETGEYPDESASLGQSISKLPVVMSVDTAATAAAAPVEDHARGVKRSRTAEDIVGELPDADKEAMNVFMKGVLDKLESTTSLLEAAKQTSADDRTLLEDSVDGAMEAMGPEFCKRMGLSREHITKLRSPVAGVKDAFEAKVMYACGLRMQAYENSTEPRQSAPASVPPPESAPIGASMFSPGYSGRSPVTSSSRSMGPGSSPFSTPRAANHGNQDMTPDQFHATIANAASPQSVWTALT